MRPLPPGWRIVAIAALLKLALLFALYPSRPRIVVNPDTVTYVNPARALLETGRFAVSPSRAGEPELSRTPGYPLLLAACFALFGPGLLAPAVLNVLFSAGTGLLAAALAHRLAGPRAARVAAAIVSFDPSGIRVATVVLSDAPFTFFLVLSLFLLVRALEGEERPAGAAAGSGLALAVATLVRPITYYLPIPLAALLLVAPGRRRARAAALFLLPSVLLVGGWQARNRARGGTWLVSQQQNVMLYFCHAAYVQARVDGVPAPEAQERFGWDELLWRFGYVEREEQAFGAKRYAEAHPETASLTVPQLARRWRVRALAILGAHPWWNLEEHARGVLCLFLGPATVLWAHDWGLLVPSKGLYDAFCSGDLLRLSGILAHEHPGLFALSALSVALVLPIYALALRGALRLPRDARTLALLLAAAYLTLVSAAPNAVDDRYRVPIVALFAVAAGAAFRYPSSRSSAASSENARTA